MRVKETNEGKSMSMINCVIITLVRYDTHLNIFLEVSCFISNINGHLLAAHQLCLLLHDRGERERKEGEINEGGKEGRKVGR